MSDATCKTCPCFKRLSQLGEFPQGECRKNAPISHPEAAHHAGFGNELYGIWPQVDQSDWCGSHPDRQPRLECAEATLVTHDDDGPSAADMRRIVDALEQMAHCAARGTS